MPIAKQHIYESYEILKTVLILTSIKHLKKAITYKQSKITKGDYQYKAYHYTLLLFDK